jgi:hypothetical protein
LVSRPDLVDAGAAAAEEPQCGHRAARWPAVAGVGPGAAAHRAGCVLGVAVEEVIEALDAKANHYAGALDAVDAQTGIPFIDALDGELGQVEYRHALRPLLDALPERERMM